MPLKQSSYKNYGSYGKVCSLANGNVVQRTVSDMLPTWIFNIYLLIQLVWGTFVLLYSTRSSYFIKRYIHWIQKSLLMCVIIFFPFQKLLICVYFMLSIYSITLSHQISLSSVSLHNTTSSSFNIKLYDFMWWNKV